MVMHVRLPRVMGIFIPVLVVVAVDEQRVVVLVRMPERPVLPFSKRATHGSAMMVRDMVVIVAVDDSRMRMCRLIAYAFHSLLDLLRCHSSHPFWVFSLLQWPAQSGSGRLARNHSEPEDHNAAQRPRSPSS